MRLRDKYLNWTPPKQKKLTAVQRRARALFKTYDVPMHEAERIAKLKPYMRAHRAAFLPRRVPLFETLNSQDAQPSTVNAI